MESKRILFMESKTTLVSDVATDLTDHNFLVKSVIIGQDTQSSSYYKDLLFDIIIIDLSQDSIISGINTARCVLEIRDIPLIFLTSSLDVNIIEEADKIKHYGNIFANSDISFIISSIETALRLHNLDQENKKRIRLLEQQNIDCDNLFLNHPAIKLMINPETGFIVDANKSAVEFYGWSYDELLLKTIQSINVLTKKEVELEIENAKKGKKFFFEFEHHIANGSIKNVLVYSNITLVAGTEYLHSIIFDITAQKKAEQKILQLLNEKEILLKEVHHRIKNNLNTILSLISFELISTEDENVKIALEKTKNRLTSIALLYNKLVITSDYSKIPTKEYLEDIIKTIINLYQHDLEIVMSANIEDFLIDSKILYSLGMIINELLTNTMKYAFIGRIQGAVYIVFEQNSSHEIFLKIQDNGIGLPESFDYQESTGFGMSIVKMLTDQLKGVFTMKSENGVISTLRFNPGNENIT